MSKVIAIINLKGGVGKSTTAATLASGGRMRGLKVLSVDLDGQRSLSFLMKANEQLPSILDVLLGNVSASEAIQRTDQGDILPASPTLAGVDLVMTGKNKDYRLRDALKSVEEDYDMIVLDLPPGLGIVTVNALTAASCAIIPAMTDILSVKGLDDIHQLIEAIQENNNPSIYIAGVLLTRWSNRSVLSKDLAGVIREAAERIGTKVFRSTIREAVAAREAQAMRQDIFMYAPKSKVAEDYLKFVDELLEDLNVRTK